MPECIDRIDLEPVRFVVPDGEASLYEVAKQAVRERLHLISNNGSQVMLCSKIPPGWQKVAVKDRSLVN